MNICIVEDEELLAEWISKKLQKNWYNVVVYNNLTDLKNWFNQASDLYIIDIWLPDWTWFQALDFLRETKKVNSPIIISSGYADIDKKVHGMNLWADDYLVKPFLPEELLVRVKALIRRSYTKSPQTILKYKTFVYDTATKNLKRWKIDIKLTKKELDLVEYFLYNKWKLISKSNIVSSVWWEYDWFSVSDNTINVTLSRVRRKLWSSFSLVTVVGDWYILRN